MTGWTPPALSRHHRASWPHVAWGVSVRLPRRARDECYFYCCRCWSGSSKNVFEMALADEHWRIVERARLTRSEFERWFANREISRAWQQVYNEAQRRS